MVGSAGHSKSSQTRPGRRARGRSERLRVAVLMGGPSSEHEVSLQGGANVAGSLDPNRFEVRPVVISRDGLWRMAPRKKALRFRASSPTLPSTLAGDGGEVAPPGFDGHGTEGWPTFAGPCEGMVELKAWGADLVFPVLHGAFGEDGTVQALLQAADLDFVGSGHRASAVAFDKIRTKEVLLAHDIPTPRWDVLEVTGAPFDRAERIDGWIESLGLPLVLKNPLGGSSLEVIIAKDAGEAAAALDSLMPKAEQVLVEAFVEGRELTAGVLEDFRSGEPQALPIVEICPRGGTTFDYFQKYSADGAEEICPAPVDFDVAAEAQRLGLLVHRLLGLRGLSRTDLRMDEGGRLQILEVNTLPGMTERGLLPLAAREIGIDFDALIAGLVRTAAVRS